MEENNSKKASSGAPTEKALEKVSAEKGQEAELEIISEAMGSTQRSRVDAEIKDFENNFTPLDGKIGTIQDPSLKQETETEAMSLRNEAIQAGEDYRIVTKNDSEECNNPENPQPLNQSSAEQNRGANEESKEDETNQESKQETENEEEKEKESRKETVEINFAQSKDKLSEIFSKDTQEEIAEELFEFIKNGFESNGIKMPEPISICVCKENNGAFNFIYESEEGRVDLSFSSVGEEKIILEMNIAPDSTEEKMEGGESAEKSKAFDFAEILSSEFAAKLFGKSEEEIKAMQEEIDNYEKMNNSDKEKAAQEYLNKYKEKRQQRREEEGRGNEEDKEDYLAEQEDIIKKYKDIESSNEFKALEENLMEVLQGTSSIEELKGSEQAEKIIELFKKIADQFDLIADWIDLSSLETAKSNKDIFLNKICIKNEFSSREFREAARKMKNIDLGSLSKEELKWYTEILEKAKNAGIIGIGFVALVALLKGLENTINFAAQTKSAAALTAAGSTAMGSIGAAAELGSGIVTNVVIPIATSKVLLGGGALAVFWHLIGKKGEDWMDNLAKLITGIPVTRKVHKSSVSK